jgi:flavin reductase (DIM6/NTAB) family NADH-FMN oxidoreductase RutF
VSTKLAFESVKGFHRSFVTGVTAVTTLEGDEPRGLLVNAFASLSLEPPTVLVCVQKTSASYPHLFAREYLAVNILAADQIDVATALSGKGPDKFATVPWTRGQHGSPILDGATAWVEAKVTERIQASTHTLFIARIVAVSHTDRPPLIYADGRFYDGGALQDIS